MTHNKNQNPEQIARDKIDQMLVDAGWVVQSKKELNLGANRGVAIKEYQTEQMEWLRMLKDHVVSSYHTEIDDLDYTPFDSKGGRAKMYQLLGKDMTGIINELNEVLAA